MMLRECLYQYYADGTIKTYDLSGITTTQLDIWEKPVEEKRRKFYTSPATRLLIKVINLGYGMYYSVDKGGSRVTESFCCFQGCDKENILAIVKVRLKQYNLVPLQPEGSHWVYTTYYNPDILTDAEKIELGESLPSLHLLLFYDHPYIKGRNSSQFNLLGEKP